AAALTTRGRHAGFALGTLTSQLAGPADRLGLLPCLLFGRPLVIVAQLHLAKHAFALQLLLQRPQRLIDIVIANDYLHAAHRPFRVRTIHWMVRQGRNRSRRRPDARPPWSRLLTEALRFVHWGGARILRFRARARDSRGYHGPSCARAAPRSSRKA